MKPTVISTENGPFPGFTDIDLTSIDGTRLRGRLWSPPNPRAILIIAHGLGEHGGSYRRTAEALGSALAIEILAVDFRGSGRSSGRRGVVGHYDNLTHDLVAAIDWAKTYRPGTPRFLFGHSNGGLVAIKTLLDQKPELRGFIVSNPSLRLSTPVPIWKRVVGEVLLRVAPWVTLSTGLSNDQLTHDPEIMAEISDDPLRHSRISPPLYFGMKMSGRQVLTRADEIQIPTLMILGGSDKIVDPEAARLFFQQLGTVAKTLKVYPSMRHEPLNEVGRKDVVRDLANWLETRLAQNPEP